MAERINKYIYLYKVQGYYSDQHKWETVTASESLSEARRDLRDYRINEPYQFRLVKGREKNPSYKGEGL